MPPLESTETSAAHTPSRRARRSLWCFEVIVMLVAASIMGWKEISASPDDFPTQKIIAIPSGSSLEQIALLLEDEHVIRSRLAFIALVQYRGAQSRIIAWDYFFAAPHDLYGVAQRLISGTRGIENIRITIPEGTSASGIGKILKKNHSEFNEAQFVALATPNEGYLFPDTYFFYSTATSGPIIETLRANFRKKTAALYNEALASKRNWEQVIIMASILEEEAGTPDDRRIVSVILWKRLEKQMPLQVDAPFAYAIGKNSATLSIDDLKIDSPYNTYRNKGLPPTPITNPGLDAIDAALHPKATPYFYYLSDKNGVMHYAKTFDEHKLNKERYLR